MADVRRNGCQFSQELLIIWKLSLDIDREIEQFWSELPNALYSPFAAAHSVTKNDDDDDAAGGGTSFTLPHGASILGDSDLGDTIYIRRHYEPLYHKINQSINLPRRRGFAVIGTSGIGLSIFGCFLLYRLKKDYPVSNILYVDYKRSPGCRAMLLPGTRAGTSAPAQVQVGPESSSFCKLVGKDGFIIYGMCEKSHAPARLNARAILLSSLGRERFKDFLNENGHQYALMPTWNRAECKEAFDMLKLSETHPHLADWETRFNFLGGVPRWVFDAATTADDAKKYFLEMTMPGARDIHSIMQAGSPTGVYTSDATHLVSFSVDSDFRPVAWRWVSDWVGQEAMQILVDAGYQFM